MRLSSILLKNLRSSSILEKIEAVIQLLWVYLVNIYWDMLGNKLSWAGGESAGLTENNSAFKLRLTWSWAWAWQFNVIESFKSVIESISSNLIPAYITLILYKCRTSRTSPPSQSLAPLHPPTVKNVSVS